MCPSNPASAPEHKAPDNRATDATEVGPGVQATGAGAGTLGDIERAEYRAEIATWRTQAEALAGALDRLTKLATNQTIPFGMPISERPTNQDVLGACDEARAALAALDVARQRT